MLFGSLSDGELTDWGESFTIWLNEPDYTIVSIGINHAIGADDGSHFDHRGVP